MTKKLKFIAVVSFMAFFSITAMTPIKKEESIRELFYSSISWVESTNNPNAVSKDGSVGIVQIRPVMVEEVNRICKMKGINKRFTLADRRNVQKSKEMFWIYQEFYNPELRWDAISDNDLEILARKWNGGPKGHVKSATKKYWNKVNKRLKKEIEYNKLSSL